MKALLFIALLFPTLVLPQPAYEGKVVAISDGDTIRVLYKGGRLKVRLAEIDTPEKGQPWGNRARQGLSELPQSPSPAGPNTIAAR